MEVPLESRMIPAIERGIDDEFDRKAAARMAAVA